MNLKSHYGIFDGAGGQLSVLRYLGNGGAIEDEKGPISPSLFMVSKLWYNYILIISDINFRWNPRKDAHYQEKHGVSFEEAKSVFFDEYARLIQDPDHSSN